jgi:hypothetical protein
MSADCRRYLISCRVCDASGEPGAVHIPAKTRRGTRREGPEPVMTACFHYPDGKP